MSPAQAEDAATTAGNVPSTGEPLRLIQAGLGGWGRDWAREVLPRVPDVACVARVDPVGQDYARLTDAVRDTHAEAVLITAPAEAHIPLAVEALREGLHVLVEKPFAYSVAEARQAVELAEERGRTLMVSQNYRFYPAARAAADLVREQKLGRLSTVRLDFRRPPHGGPKNRHHRLAHPLLFDMAIHHFDLMRMVVGQEPVEVYVKPIDPAWSRFDHIASAVAVITFSAGTVVAYRGSWESSGQQTTWSGEWHVECENGEIFWTSRGGGAGNPSSDLVELRPLGEDARPAALPDLPAIGRAGALLEFVRCIRTGEQPETSGRRNLGSLALSEAAHRSAVSGRPEPVRVPPA